MLKHGENAYTNKFIKFEDIQNINIETLICTKYNNRELPKNITKYKQFYRTKIEYNKVKFKACSYTLEHAEEKLLEFKKQIQVIKDQDYNDHLKIPITRNNDGKAVLHVKNKNGEIIAEPIVNDDRWHELSKYTWIKSNNYYFTNNNGKLIRLKPGEIADHINNDGN